MLLLSILFYFISPIYIKGILSNRFLGCLLVLF